ncbi:MAG: extracellular solute-binding protein [Ruminiclostridium sp.]|nr:extracellular solute-binding protein [Ruminiclostridium sp.]
MTGEKRFKILTLVLVSVFIFSVMAGCAQKAGTGETTTAAGTAAATTQAEELPVVDIELSNADVPGLDNPEALKKDRILQKINETLRINLTFKTAFLDEYIQKMQLAIQAGNASDIMIFPVNSSNANADVLYNKGVEEGLFIDIGEYVSKDPKRYAALDLVMKDPVWKMINYVDNSGEAEKTVAGHGLVYRKNVMGAPFINMRVLKPLGLSVPTTFDEFVNVLRAIKKGNPKVIPFSYNSNKGTSITYDIEQLFYATHGTGVLQLVPDEQGYFHDYSTSDKTKEVTKLFVDLYKEGLIDKEIMTKEAWSNYDDFAMGKTAIVTVVGPALYAGEFDNYKKYFPDATIEDVQVPEPPIVGPAGTGMTYNTAMRPTTRIVVSKASKNADRALDFVNYMYSDAGQRTIWYGVEGVHYKLDASGNITDFNLNEYLKDTGEIYYSTSNAKRADWAPFSYVIAMGRYLQIEKEGSFSEALKKGIDLAPERTENTPQVEYLNKALEIYYDKAFTDNPPYVAFVKMSPAEEKLKSKLNDIRKKWFVPFLIGEKDLEKEWANYVQEMNDAGIVEYEKAYNQKVQETKKIYDKIVK